MLNSMENAKIPGEIRAELNKPESPWGDVVSEIVGPLLEEISDLAKKELARRDGLTLQETAEPLPTLDKARLPKWSKFRDAKTVAELGLTEESKHSG